MKTITHPAGNWLLATRNYALLFGLILTICSSAFADELPIQQWVARYNGPGNSSDSANALKIDDSGNVYVTGGSYDSVTSTDYATIKYSPNGNQLWAARYNGPADSSDNAYALAVDNSGNVYVTGASVGIGTFWDYATVKYSPDGNQLWVARYNGPQDGNDRAGTIAVDNSGNVYVTGYCNDTGGIGPGLNLDYATIKYGPDGNQLWAALYNGPGNGYDGASDLKVDSSGNVYVTGESAGSSLSYDYATIKYGPGGNQLWVARYNGDANSSDIAHALAVDSSGNVYVTGDSAGSGTSWDYATVKYSPDGNQLWAARYNGPGNVADNAYDLAVDGSGNVYVTGYSDGGGTSRDYATIKYSPSGGQLWAARYNGPGNSADYATSLVVDNSGNVYVTGQSSGSGTSSDYATVKYGPNGSQIWLARYNGPGNSSDSAQALAVNGSGNVYITGYSRGSGTYDDYATIKYAQGSLVYVDANATGDNNGSNWEDAYTYLQGALWAAGSGKVIWVAQGTYRPDEDSNEPNGWDDRYATFQLENGVEIYGGFPTGGGVWESRDPNAYQTILSGDIGIADNNSDNSYHVVYGSGTNSTAVLDGFTITAGNANGSDEYYLGGGMYNYSGSPTMANCTFSGNSAYYGGGIFNDYNSSPTLTHCIFSGNSALYAGGGMRNSVYSNPTLTYCTFRGNWGGTGGGMYNYPGSPTVTNCIFSGNSAGTGGGMYNEGNPPITNCTFSGNSAIWGGGMYNYNWTSTVTNCILWGNTATNGPQIYNAGTSSPVISYCDVQDGWSGTGNIDADPLFVDADGPDNILGTEDDNLRLLSGSPCIDAADNNAVPEGIETDLDGLARFKDDPATFDTGNGTPPIVDMGAYEYRPVIYVDANAMGGNNGSSWANAYNDLQAALSAAGSDFEIWVAKGTYRPDSGSGSRIANFHLKNGVAIYGGFPAGGGVWSSRDPNAYKTILSGDIGAADVNSDNSYHVVTGAGTDSTAVIDGFTISDGNASLLGPLRRDMGAGMFNSAGSPTVNNCVFKANKARSDGGGMYNYNSSPLVTNCTFSGNSASRDGGAMFNYSGTVTATDCTFIDNSALRGGGVFNSLGSRIMNNCSFTGNSATDYGGGLCGIFNFLNGDATLTSCSFSNNWSPYGGGIYVSNNSITLNGNNNFNGNTANLGDGICSENGGVITIGSSGSVYTSDEFYITDTSQLLGGGNLDIELGGELIIDSNAVVDLSDPNVPDANGTIQCDGLLRVKDNARLSHATLNISRQAGGFFGKFELEGSAEATNLDIYTDGDRFMDVNYLTFTGIIANNRIYVTITEGQNGTLEGILELRGQDINHPGCDFNDTNLLYCQLDSGDMPAFDTNSWMLEQLTVAAGAKVSLADRFDSNNGYPEVLYVKNLVLGADCNLNVGFERLYFQNRSGDVNSIMRDALLAISLDDMNFDSNEEFESRVSNNNYINPAEPSLNRIQVERVLGLEPDPNGMMIMRNLEDEFGQMISARAKTEYAPASEAEDEVRIRFNYLFNTPDPCAQIVVYLSDVPELGDLNDANNYIEVARISNPPEGRPGSFDSNRFGNFEMFVLTDGLDLSQGTWIELVLMESGSGMLLASAYDKRIQLKSTGEGDVTAYVNDEEVGIYCGWGVCLDLNGDRMVTESDFMRVISGAGSNDERTACREGGFTSDGYTDSYDAQSWDWTLNLQRQNYCGEMRIPLTGSESGFAFSSFGRLAGRINKLNLAGLDDLLITGKRGTADAQTKMKDRFYVFDDSGAYLQWLDPCSERCNVRIVRGAADDLYQVNLESGVSRLETGELIVPMGEIACANEPRYHLPATVYVGVHPDGEDNFFGRPILDAAFDTNTSFIYVVPVVVDPAGEDANAYTAAAKLQLAPGQSPPYSLVKLYDGPVSTGDNQCQYRNTLREIELDDACNVYVSNAHIMNESDILWKFEPGGAVQRLNLVDPNEPCHIPSPTAMYVSKATNILYLASSQPGAQPGSVVIHGFSTASLAPVRTITVSGMQYITSITEDLTTGSLWVAGFSFNSNPRSAYSLPFYDPNLAKVPLRVNNVSAVCILGANDLAMPLSIVWTGDLPPLELCGGADLNGSNRVSLADLAILAKHWLDINCVAPGNCEGADLEPQTFGDGDVDIWDLDILAEHWLDTGCLGP